MAALNLGILAHVDAGKTSLTERLLYDAGVIDHIGRVDDGTTQTDTLALEQRRGITIRSAVVSFEIDGRTTNLIDTPGHSDFIAEVERVLDVLDGAVVVVSAVEGVQAQTRVLMRVLRRLRIPTLIFVNKIDRAGASPARVLAEIGERLVPNVVAMGEVRAAGTPHAAFAPFDARDDRFAADLLDRLTLVDDRLLCEVVEDAGAVSPDRIGASLAEQTALANVCPVYFGSAVTGSGVEELRSGIASLLPATDGADAGDPVLASVFKIERGPAGEKLTYVRMRAGTLRIRDRLTLAGRSEQKITAIEVFDGGTAVNADAVGPGRIARVSGLASARVGDTIGIESSAPSQTYFAPPSLETIVDARRADDGGALHAALSQLAEQDPLIDMRHDERRGETSVSLYGEVQKEVIAATLADEYGVEVTFRETTMVCIERPAGTGAAVEIIDTADNPFLATVGLRVEPAPIGCGVQFGLAVELGSMPRAFFTAVEQAVRTTLREGLYGWVVPDCRVTMTHSGYWPRQSHAHGTFDASMSSTAGDFRNLTPLVLREALRRAGTVVHEPMHRFELEVPHETLGGVLSALPTLRCIPLDTRPAGGAYLVSGHLPAAYVHRLRQRVPALTNGEGMLVTEFDHHRPVTGSATRRSASALSQAGPRPEADEYGSPRGRRVRGREAG